MPFTQNPFASANPFANEDWTGLGIPRRRPEPQFAPLPTAEAEPLKDSLVNKGLSGLAWVGGTLDKAFGARALRGIAAGDWGEAKSIIPFSDTLGITDPANSHSMDEVLQKYNVVGKNDPDKWELRDFLVPAAEIAADPGTYLTWGTSALTRAGRVAKAAGVLPRAHRAAIEGFHALEPALSAAGRNADEIAHLARAGQRIAPEAVANAGVRANEPLAGLVGFGLPFRQPAFTVGHGPVAQSVAGGFDAAKQGLKYAPGVRFARSLFDTNAGRSTNAVVQQANEVAARPASRAVDAAAHELEHSARFGVEPLLNGPGVPQGVERELTRLIRQRGENIAQANDPALWQSEFLRRHGAGQVANVTDPNAVVNHVTRNWNQLADIGDQFRRTNEGWLQQARELGGRGADAADENAAYLMRQYIGAGHQTGANAARTFNPTSASDIARQSIFRVPGGTEMINDLAIDPALSGVSRTLDQAGSTAEIMNRLTHQMGIEGRLATLTPEAQRIMEARAGGLARFLGALPDIHAQSRVPYFDPDTIGSMLTRGQRQAATVGNLSGLYEGIGRAARAIDPASPVPQGMVPVRQFLDDAGLTTRTVPATMPPGFIGPAPAAYQGAAARAYEALARHGVPYRDLAAGGDPFATLGRFAIPEREAGALRQYMAGWSPKPHELGPITRAYDSAANVFRNMVYPLWPAAHVRNATGAAYNHLVNGLGLREAVDAARVMRGTGLRDIQAYAHLDPNWATMTNGQRGDLLHRLAYAHGKVFQNAGGAAELVGREGLEPLAERITTGGRLSPQVPGNTANLTGPRGVLAEARQRGLSSLNPLGQAGAFGRTADTFAPLVAGRRAGTNVEDFARLSTFLGGLRRGMTPEVAGDLVAKAHFDYSNLTRFEKEVMKRVFPFYTFARKNLPEQLRTLASQPGNLSAPIKALTNVDGNREGYTPDYLSSGVAIPMGQNVGPDGRTYTRYLNRVGLPFEEAFERMRFNDNLPAPLATAMTTLGSANPYVKAPLEAMTDTQFHTGRKLSDLRAGGLWSGYGVLPDEVAQPLTQIMANSPLARFGTTLDKAVDPRKGLGLKALNLLTGVGVTDVDAEKLRGVEARRELEAQLKADPNIRQFTNLYVKPGQAANLSPESANLMRLYAGMKGEAKVIADQKAEAETRAKLRDLLGGGF